MFLLSKKVDALTESDIQNLIESQVAESRLLDYKKVLKVGSDKDRKEFLYDISAMYNTDGGCIIYGIEEAKDDNGHNTGTPFQIDGINIENEDKLVQSLESTIEGNTDPKIGPLLFKVLDMNERKVLVIGIPKRLGPPSMITFKQSNKFYCRRNSGKYLADTRELRNMFVQDQLIRDKIQQFREERTAKVISRHAFPNLETTSSFFIQIVPYSLLENQIVDFQSHENVLIKYMRPMYSEGGYSTMYNLYGFATHRSDAGKVKSYVQLIRNGSYESYTSDLFYKKDDTYVFDGDSLFLKL